ncbi:MAG: linear amide C-N hydrolase [Bacteroidales bacterium]|nr:linear amide C-N hydrolase [Candidatus Equimonas faecalis]
MKKIIYAFTVCAVVLFTGSCSKDETEMFTAEQIDEYNFQKVELKRINDYLFEVTNNDFYTRYYFNPYSVGDEFMGLKEWHGVCAGVRNGDFIGRNFDWECSETPEFIVHIPADGDRHASVGICNSNMVKHAPTEDWLSQMLVNDISNNCFDGINDCGVCAISLVVHYADDTEATLKGTKPGSSFSLHGANVVRYVLDKATSAKEAVRLLQEANIYGSLGEYSFHWMICDEKDNYLVELINSKVVATKAEDNPIERFRKPVITNFYLFKDLSKQKVPCGVERYGILEANYANAGSAKGMFETMEKVRYSRKYDGKDPSTLAGAPDLNWYSEYLAHMPNYKNTTGPLLYNEFPKTDEDRRRIWRDIMSLDIERNAISKFENPRMNPMSAWTCHTTVYNIKERTMQIVIGEKYDDIIPSATTSFKINGL